MHIELDGNIFFLWSWCNFFVPIVMVLLVLSLQSPLILTMPHQLIKLWKEVGWSCSVMPLEIQSPTLLGLNKETAVKSQHQRLLLCQSWQEKMMDLFLNVQHKTTSHQWKLWQLLLFGVSIGSFFQSTAYSKMVNNFKNIPCMFPVYCTWGDDVL